MYHISIHRALIALLLCGTLIYTNVSYANHINAGSHRYMAINAENQRVKRAITKLGNHDSGEALLTYYRSGHILEFQVTDYDARDKFTGNNLRRQIEYFQSHAQLQHLNVQVQLTKKALHKHHVQLREQADQRKENHLEAMQAIKRAKQQAKHRVQLAKHKAEQEAKQKVHKEAQQRRQQQEKKAKQHAIQRKKQNQRQKNQKRQPKAHQKARQQR